MLAKEVFSKRLIFRCPDFSEHRSVRCKKLSPTTLQTQLCDRYMSVMCSWKPRALAHLAEASIEELLVVFLIFDVFFNNEFLSTLEDVE
jgi:hypothetical protein